MYLYLKDSTIKISEIAAVTKVVIPATNFTPKYFAMCVYVKGFEPIVHSYETEEERDSTFSEVSDILNGRTKEIN